MTITRTLNHLLPVLTGLALILFGVNAMAIEEPAYTVISQHDDIEIRQYAPFIVAETLVTEADSRNAANNEGFRRLFRYITGSNQARAKIEMTAPVLQSGESAEKNTREDGQKIAMTAPVQQKETDSGWQIAFVLPAQFDMRTAPVPTDDRITLREMPSRTVAVQRFSGRWTDKNFRTHRKSLSDFLDSNKLEAVGEMEYAAYNAPFTLPFMRRNEVMVEIESIE